MYPMNWLFLSFFVLMFGMFFLPKTTISLIQAQNVNKKSLVPVKKWNW